MKIVEGISFQTSILAINATIEAAKVGELGKGFGVVAVEVRELAQRVADATKDIKHLINDSTQKVKTGESLVQENNAHLNEIYQAVLQELEVIAEIANFNKQIYHGLKSINSAVEKFNTTNHETKSYAHAMTNLGKEMFAETERMDALIAVNFRKNN
ncbi:MAG: hypothetical protein HQK52_23710 [Oligoflexia bacterium]|nr:hypothetical protein [Oligoflexia bacterium]